jgi:hypothetical protein
VSTIIPIALILCLTLPVNAYYFEFQYFETDRTVYEVGQTIDMIAKMIAEFSDEGWCHVSFGVVTDLGPIFDDGYYLESSMDPQFAVSSYTILPNETHPGMNGITAYIVFNAEIYDGYSQGSTETLEVNITRGHLSTIPLSELDIPHGTDSNISLKIASAHNEYITLQDHTLSYQIDGIETIYTMNGNTTINSEGIATIPWNTSNAIPGEYLLNISTIATESFLPLAETLTMRINRPNSSLNLKPYLQEIPCPHYDGSDIAAVSLLADHIGEDGERISDSNLSWKTSFSQSSFTNHWNGSYSASVEFPVTPGNYTVLIMAENNAYASVNITKTVLVTKRTLSVNYSLPNDMIAGNETLLELRITDSLLGTRIPYLGFTINISLGSQILYSTTDAVDIDGLFTTQFTTSPSLWGVAEISIELVGDENYSSSTIAGTKNVEFVPEICWTSTILPVIGQNMNISVKLLNPNDELLAGVPLSLLDFSGQNIDATYTAADGNAQFVWTISTDFPSGAYQYTIVSNETPSQYIASGLMAFELVHHDLLSVHVLEENLEGLRGKNATLSLSIESKWNQSRDILMRFSLSTLTTINRVIKSDVVQVIQIPIPQDSTLGMHKLTIDVLNSTCVLSGSIMVDINILGHIVITIEGTEAFYAESFSMNLSLVDELGLSLDYFVVYIFIDTYFMHAILNETKQDFAISSSFSPGIHAVTIVVNGTHYESAEQEISVTIWMRTSLSLVLDRGEPDSPDNQDDERASIISSGSIISPPPTLLSGMTSTRPSTARSTSRESCPRLSSGTKNRSTDSANALTSSSGKGQMVLSLSDFIDNSPDDLNITSSTVREVHPNDTIPHSAFCGPSMITSVRMFRLRRILSRSLSTSSR